MTEEFLNYLHSNARTAEANAHNANASNSPWWMRMHYFGTKEWAKSCIGHIMREIKAHEQQTIVRS